MPTNAAGLVTAYHPSVTSVRQATSVNVEAGGEARDVNIKFDEEPRRLSGKVKWKEGDTPVKQATIFLRRTGDPQTDLDPFRFVNLVTPDDVDKVELMVRDVFFISLLSTNAPYVESDDTGHWSFLDVPAGTYSIAVMAALPDKEPVPPKSGNEGSLDDFVQSLPDADRGVARGSAEVTIRDKNVDDLVIELSEGASISGSVATMETPPAPQWA